MDLQDDYKKLTKLLDGAVDLAPEDPKREEVKTQVIVSGIPVLQEKWSEILRQDQLLSDQLHEVEIPADLEAKLLAIPHKKNHVWRYSLAVAATFLVAVCSTWFVMGRPQVTPSNQQQPLAALPLHALLTLKKAMRAHNFQTVSAFPTIRRALKEEALHNNKLQQPFKRKIVNALDQEQDLHSLTNCTNSQRYIAQIVNPYVKAYLYKLHRLKEASESGNFAKVFCCPQTTKALQEVTLSKDFKECSRHKIQTCKSLLEINDCKDTQQEIAKAVNNYITLLEK